jgi:hypothetical protein
MTERESKQYPGHKGAEAALSFPHEGGGWLLNATDEALVLREPSLEECSDHLAAFRKVQLRLVVDHLCEPNRTGRHVVGMAGNRSRQPAKATKDAPVHWGPTIIALDDVPPDLWSLLPGETAENEARNMLISRAPLEAQRAFVRALMTGDAEKMATRMKSYGANRLIHTGLEDALRTAESGMDFVHAVLGLVRAEEETTTSRLAGRRQGNPETKSPVPFLFALHLCGKGVLLLPLGTAGAPGKADSPGFAMAGRLVGPRLGAAAARFLEKAHAANKSKGQRVERLLHALAGVSTFSRDSLATPEGFAAVRDLLRDKGLATVPEPHVLFAEVYDALRPAGSPPLPKVRRKSSAERLCIQCGTAIPEEHAWTTEGSEEHVLEPGVPAKFASPRLQGKGETVQHYAHVLDATLKKRQNVRIGPLISHLKKFLEWVAWRHSEGELVETQVPCVPIRSEIKDDKDDDASPSFRSWLYRNHGPETANKTLASLSEYFAIHLATLMPEKDSQVIERLNPIKLKVDTFPREAPEPSKTVRTPIPRALLALLLDENRRDDYALSRGNPEHLRSALDPATGEYRKIWFPGPALLLELLILLPLRSFQARFLDSGELDETRHRIVAGKLESGKNPTGTKKRSEGVIRPFTDMEGEQSPGLHINTNKTGTESDGHQFIPWASEDILRLVERMSSWQEAHNPRLTLVPCSEKEGVDKLRRRGSATEKRFKKTIPLFRDPADADGWPLTRSALNQHWIKVNEAVERRLADAGKKALLVEKKTGTDGRMTKTATSDIHTLRVSGISGMVNAGISPELVREIAGHSTLIMTLYYVKTGAEAMRQKLDAGWADFFKASDDPALGEADFLELSKSLFNSGETDLPKEMLARERRLGRGTLHVFTHGVCPGGDCDSGGEDGAPLPRAEACPLCRYRLTGPAFLPGLVMNANVLIHELRSLGLEIGALNAEIRALEDAGKMSAPLKAKVEALYRKSDAAANEWAAEAQYAKVAQDWLERSGPGEAAPVVFGAPAPECRLERASHFDLLQRLAEGGQTFPGSCPSVVLTEHREYLNELLMASDMDPLLLKLKGGLRDKAAALLGKAVAGMVPEETQDGIRAGRSSLADFPNFENFFETLKAGVAAGALDWTKPGPMVLQDKGDGE